MSRSSGGAFGALPAAADDVCPCGGYPSPGTTYQACCGRWHGGEPAPNAQALMRSRYTAFAIGAEDYLLRTWHPRTRPESLQLTPGHAWTGLQILAVESGGPEATEGMVRYRALSRGIDGSRHVLIEASRFVRRGGRWMYLDGDVDPGSS